MATAVAVAMAAPAGASTPGTFSGAASGSALTLSIGADSLAAGVSSVTGSNNPLAAKALGAGSISLLGDTAEQTASVSGPDKSQVKAQECGTGSIPAYTAAFPLLSIGIGCSSGVEAKTTATEPTADATGTAAGISVSLGGLLSSTNILPGSTAASSLLTGLTSLLSLGSSATGTGTGTGSGLTSILGGADKTAQATTTTTTSSALGGLSSITGILGGGTTSSGLTSILSGLLGSDTGLAGSSGTSLLSGLLGGSTGTSISSVLNNLPAGGASLSTILDNLLDNAEQTLGITAGATTSSLTTASASDGAADTANGASISVLTVLGGAPLIKITVGTSGALATFNTSTGVATPSVNPAIVTISIAGGSPITLSLGDQPITLLGGTPLAITIDPSSGSVTHNANGSVTATATGVQLDLLQGLFGGTTNGGTGSGSSSLTSILGGADSTSAVGLSSLTSILGGSGTSGLLSGLLGGVTGGGGGLTSILGGTGTGGLTSILGGTTGAGTTGTGGIDLTLATSTASIGGTAANNSVTPVTTPNTTPGTTCTGSNCPNTGSLPLTGEPPWMPFAGLGFLAMAGIVGRLALKSRVR